MHFWSCFLFFFLFDHVKFKNFHTHYCNLLMQCHAVFIWVFALGLLSHFLNDAFCVTWWSHVSSFAFCFQVRSKLESLDGIVPPTHGFTISSTGMKNVWLSMEHQVILWCNQLVVQASKISLSKSHLILVFGLF